MNPLHSLRSFAAKYFTLFASAALRTFGERYAAAYLKLKSTAPAAAK